MEIWQAVSYGLLIAYSGLILFYFAGWILIKPFRRSGFEPNVQSFSILIPARNEEETIIPCLESIVSQKFATAHFEVIVLNDHSSDQTAHLVQAYINENNTFNIQLVNLEEHIPEGAKKEAITYGISISKNQFIILTDSDCTRGETWLAAIDSFIQKKNSKMIYAPVLFHAKNAFEKIQALEFSGLVGIGASAIRLKNPNMCSAANLVFEKAVFAEIGGYQNDTKLATGDDEFLLHKVFKKYPDQVFFLKCEDAIVETSPNHSVQELSQQRRRWVSRSTQYDNRYITAILAGAYFFNFTIVFNLLAGFANRDLLNLGLNQLILKMFIEGLFLFSILRFFKKSSLIFYLPLAEPFHILYVLIIGIWANIASYHWKGRKLK